jgi:hypothetical protein
VSSALLSRKRLRYAWIAGGALWAGWLVSLLAGRQGLDLAGQVIGGDYLQFYAAGDALRLGESPRLYDMAYQFHLQQQIIGPSLTNYYAFITPPFLAWLYEPLSALPYRLSFALWSLFGLAALWCSIRLVDGVGLSNALVWSLTWFPVFASVSYGQNSLLSLLLLAGVYRLWRSSAANGGKPLSRIPYSLFPYLAGLMASLLLYKPQLLIGVVVLWLLEWRRDIRPLLGLVTGGAALAALCMWKLPAAARSYWAFARNVLPNLPSWLQFPLWNLHTVRGFWRLLLPGFPLLADALYAGLVCVGVAGFVCFWRKHRGQPELLFAGAVCLTFWATPHAMIYDWALLLIPALLLWRAAPDGQAFWRIAYVAIWVATLVSGPLVRGQLALSPIAVQVSVPILLAIITLCYRRLPSESPGTDASLGRTQVP